MGDFQRACLDDLGSLVLTQKNTHCESGKLSFIWGKMRTAAWKTTPMIALRNFSKETEEKGQYICDFGEEGMHTVKHIFFAGFC